MRALLLFIALLGPACGAGAASVQLSAPGAKPRLVQVEARRTDGADTLERTEAQYRAAYYYSLAVLASLGGDHKSSALLLERAGGADPDSALLRLERAEELEASGEDAQAAVLMRAALEQDPADIGLRRRLSRLYQRTDKVGEARRLFLMEDGSDPKDPAWLRALVGLDLLQEDLAGAEARLRTLMKSGGDADDRELLAMTLQRRKDWKGAAEQLALLVAAEPSRTAAWARLSACDEAAGDTAAARKALEDGLKATPDSPLLSDQQGRLLYRLDDYPGAEKAFSSLVEKDASDSHSLLYRGLSRLKSRRYSEAEADFTALGALEKDDPGQGYALALAMVMQKKYPQAEAQLKHVLELNPQSEPAWVQLAFIYDRQKQPAKAAEAVKQGLKALPRSEQLALLLAAAQEDAGDLASAEDALREGLRKGGGDELRFQLAVLLDKRGHFDEAEKELKLIIAATPAHAQALNYLGYSYADRGVHLDEAQDLIRRALAADPGNHYYLDSLGWALFKADKPKEALSPLDEAAKKVGPDAEDGEAVVFDHLALVQKSLGQVSAAQRSEAKAAEIRRLAKVRQPQDPDPAKEPGL